MRHHYRPNQTFSSFKSQKNTQVSMDPSTPRTQSFRLKPSKSTSSAPIDAKNPEIYFNSNKRKSYLKNVIDNYFNLAVSQSKRTSIRIPSPRSNSRLIKRNDVYTSQGIKKRPVISATNKAFQFSINALQSSDQLPIISQVGFTRRPISSQKSQRSGFFRKLDLEDSLFNDSSRSIHDSKFFNQELADFQNKSSNTQSSHQKSKKINVRVFANDKDEQLIREKQIKKLGYNVLWHQTQQSTIFVYPKVKKLQEICYSIIQDKKGNDPLVLIYPKEYYFRLFANQCEQLKDILVGMAKTIAKGKGIVSCNQINMKNIIKLEEKRFQICDWGCAAIHQTLKVRDRQFDKFHIPYCKIEDKWMVAPQYLAPELLRAIQLQSYEHLWGQKGGISACDVWSLGCLLLELITLIPLGQINHCAIKGGSHSKKGILGIKTPTSDGLLQKHKYFRTLALRRIKDHVQQFKLAIPQKITNLLPQMIQSDPAKRISVSEILQILQ